MKIKDISTPVVILKMEHYGSLGIVRSLGRLGISVYGVDPNPRVPGFRSRYCRGKFIWDIDKASPESTIDFLLAIGKNMRQPPILIPTSDETSMLVAGHADTLKEWFIFPYVNSDLVTSLCNKKEMFLLAQKLGIPTAQTEFPQSRDDVIRYAITASFPMMLKGIDGKKLETRTGKKMVIVRNYRELLEKYDAMEDPNEPNLMLQEYIPGGDDSVWMFNGYFDDRSECLIEFTGKKIRQNPVYTGMTSLGICLRNETVAETTKKFMKAIGYRGILDIGYRHDTRDGLYKVLDVNPRIGATFRLFVASNGMDVARALYLDMTGQSVPYDVAPDGRKWFVEDKDLLSCRHYLRDRKLTVREWMASYRGVKELGYFSFGDPRPFGTMILNHFRRQIGKIVGKFISQRSLDQEYRGESEPQHIKVSKHQTHLYDRNISIIEGERR